MYNRVNYLDPFQYFRIGSIGQTSIEFIFNNINYKLNLVFGEEAITVKLSDSKIINVSIMEKNNETIRALIENEVRTYKYFIHDKKISVWDGEQGKFDFFLKAQELAESKSNQDTNGSDGRIFASMPCKINQIMVRAGDVVKIGSPLCVTEAMKMEVPLLK